MEKRLDDLKREIYYNRSHSEMLRSIVKAGLDAMLGDRQSAPAAQRNEA